MKDVLGLAKEKAKRMTDIKKMTTLKQTFIVNSDLKMSAGKIAAQVAHAEVLYMALIKITPSTSQLAQRYHSWRYDDNELMKKIILKATEAQIYTILNKMRDIAIICYDIHDRGLTQVEPESLTCIIVEPLPEEDCQKLFGHLKLL